MQNGGELIGVDWNRLPASSLLWVRKPARLPFAGLPGREDADIRPVPSAVRQRYTILPGRASETCPNAGPVMEFPTADWPGDTPAWLGSSP
jgi:hypothetical protein